MAWKKVDESKRVGYIHYAFRKGNENKAIISLNRVDLYTNEWTVSYFPESNKKKYFKKKFKTKAQALKFAKASLPEILKSAFKKDTALLMVEPLAFS